MGVLRLQLPTDPRWVIMKKHRGNYDHAWCEQKAANKCYDNY
jgi:hypothetical protein